MKELRGSFIYGRVKTIITISASILSIFFAWLQFDEISLQPIMSSEISNLLFKVALSLYYFSWIFGTIGDMESEEETFRLHPKVNELSIGAIGVIAVIVILFATLCFTSTFESFIIALSLLLAFNIFSWRYLIWFLKPIFKKNKQAYILPIEFEYHYVLEEYILGKWQIYRFIYGGILICVLNLLIFTDLLNNTSRLLKSNSQFIVSIALLFYVITFEAWVWIKRIIRIYTFHVLEELDRKYQINRKSN
jgi:hypothetical protein